MDSISGREGYIKDFLVVEQVVFEVYLPWFIGRYSVVCRECPFLDNNLGRYFWMTPEDKNHKDVRYHKIIELCPW